MYLNIVLFFLVFSVLLYVILAGADYGAGILELFTTKKDREVTKKTIYRVIGPVWEANHVWIIITIVILWVGFPAFYNIIVIYLHVPITLMLIGVTLRGVAFVFRHYDAYQDNSHKIYDVLFRFSSVFTPLMIGCIFGAMIGGKIDLEIVNKSFSEIYIYPWFNIFSILIGIFFTALCTFLSSILLIGESNASTRKIFVNKALYTTVFVVCMGFICLIYGYYNHLYFVIQLIQNYTAIALMTLSGILLFPLWACIKNQIPIGSRVLAGLQVIIILSVPAVEFFPSLIFTSTGNISILDNIAPESVFKILALMLIIGGSLILPGLFHLFKSFKMIKILER